MSPKGWPGRRLVFGSQADSLANFAPSVSSSFSARWSSGPELKPRFTGVGRNGQQSRLQVDSSGKLWSPLSIPFTPRVVSSSTLYRVPTSSHALIFFPLFFTIPFSVPPFAFPAHFQSPFKIFFTSIFLITLTSNAIKTISSKTAAPNLSFISASRQSTRTVLEIFGNLITSTGDDNKLMAKIPTIRGNLFGDNMT